MDLDYIDLSILSNRIQAMSSVVENNGNDSFKITLYLDEARAIVKALDEYATKLENADKLRQMTIVELWDDSDIDGFVDTVYEECKGKDCDKCPHRVEVDGEACKTDIINELWRKWHKAKGDFTK